MTRKRNAKSTSEAVDEVSNVRDYLEKIRKVLDLESATAMKSAQTLVANCEKVLADIPLSAEKADVEVELLTLMSKIEQKHLKLCKKKRETPVGNVSSDDAASNQPRTPPPQANVVEEQEHELIEFKPFEPASEQLEESMKKQRMAWYQFKTYESLLFPLTRLPPDLCGQLRTLEPRFDKLVGHILDMEDKSKQDDTLEPVIEAYSEWQDRLHKQWSALFEEYVIRSKEQQEIIISTPKGKTTLADRSADVTTSTTTSSSNSKPKPTIRLAKKPISRFTGDPKSWNKFRRDMTRLIEDQYHSDSIKFDELEDATKDHPVAYNIVERYADSCDVIKAVEALRKEFEDPIKLIEDLEKFVEEEVEVVPDNYSSKDIESFYLDLQFVSQHLKLAEADDTTRNKTVKPLREKLPGIIVSQLRKRHNEFGEFMSFIEELHDAHVAMPSSTKETLKKQPTEKNKPNNNPTCLLAEGSTWSLNSDVPVPTQSYISMQTQPKAIQRNPGTSCVFCPSNDHISKFCPKDPKMRQQRLWVQRICYRCLVRPHPCKCKERCGYCTGGHHLMICGSFTRYNSNQQSGTSELNSSAAVPPSTSSEEETSQEIPHGNFAAFQTTYPRATPETVSEIRGTPAETWVSDRSLVGQSGEEPSLAPGHVLAGCQLLSAPMVSSLPHPDSVPKTDFQQCQLVGHPLRRRTNEDILTLKREREEVPNSRNPEEDEWFLADLPKPRGEWPLAHIESFAVHVSLPGECVASQPATIKGKCLTEPATPSGAAEGQCEK